MGLRIGRNLINYSNKIENLYLGNNQDKIKLKKLRKNRTESRKNMDKFNNIKKH